MNINLDLCFKEFKDFIIYSENVKSSSEKTIYNYYRDLMLFFRYMKFIKGKCKPNVKIEDIYITDIDSEFIAGITSDDIFRYFQYLTVTRKNNDKTVARRTTTLRMFFRFIHINQRIIPYNPVEEFELPPIKHSEPKYMSETDCIELLNSIDGQDKERDYCILVVFINCGLKLNELVSMDDTDIKPDGTAVIHSADNTDRIIGFNDACQEAFREYQDYKKEFFYGKTCDRHAIFIGRTGNRLTGRRVEQIVKARMTAAGFGDRGLSPNKLRHTAATVMYKRGVDVEILKEILGHLNLNSTQIYTKKSTGKIEEIMNQSPIGRNKK